MVPPQFDLEKLRRVGSHIGKTCKLTSGDAATIWGVTYRGVIVSTGPGGLLVTVGPDEIDSIETQTNAEIFG